MTAATAAVVVVAVVAVVVGTPYGFGNWVGQVVGNLEEGRLPKHPFGTLLRLRSATPYVPRPLNSRLDHLDYTRISMYMHKP